MQFYCVPGTRTLDTLLPLRGPRKAVGKGYRPVDGVGYMGARWDPGCTWQSVDGSAVDRAVSASFGTSTAALVREDLYFGTQGVLALTL